MKSIEKTLCVTVLCFWLFFLFYVSRTCFHGGIISGIILGKIGRDLVPYLMNVERPLHIR
jgi:multisubunit Na+/H+ antiporter MnhE subunit